jgi:hypothetical protein
MHTKCWCLETLLPHSTNLRRCDYVYSSLLPQEFSSEEPLPDGSSIQSILLSVAPLPDIRNSSFGSAPLLSLENPHPPLLPEQILLHGVSATSLVSQPPLATDQSVCPGPFGFSCNESYPSDFQPFPERAYEGHDTTLAGFLANGDQIPNDLYLCVRPKTQLDSLPHTSAPISSNAWSPNVENPHEPELSSYGSSQGIQGFKRQITLPVSVSIRFPYLMRFRSHDLSAATSQSEEKDQMRCLRSLSSRGNEEKIQVQSASKTRYCSHQEYWGLCYLSEKEATCK